MSYVENFTSSILDNSISEDWQGAKEEWIHVSSYVEEEMSTCVCSHPIKNVCIIKNRHNGRELEVGNCCVKKFDIDDRSSDFKLLKHNRIDIKLLDELLRNSIINYKTYEFMVDINRKRKLSDKQLQWKEITLSKAKNYIMKKKRGIIDPHVFKPLNNIMEKQHKQIMVQKMKEVILDTVADKPIEDLMQDLKGILISLDSLRKHYNK